MLKIKGQKEGKEYICIEQIWFVKNIYYYFIGKYVFCILNKKNIFVVLLIFNGLYPSV
jgi:hypothetical protein